MSKLSNAVVKFVCRVGTFKCKIVSKNESIGDSLFLANATNTKDKLEFIFYKDSSKTLFCQKKVFKQGFVQILKN